MTIVVIYLFINRWIWLGSGAQAPS